MAGVLLAQPLVQQLNVNANPISGAVFSFFLTGTTTPATVYADAGLQTPLGTSVTTDGAGRQPNIYLDGEVEYRLKIFSEASGTLIRDIDPVSSIFQASLIKYTPPGVGAVLRSQEDYNKDRRSVMDFIPTPLHANIRSGVGAVVDSYVEAALAAGVGYFPAGKYLGTRQWVVPEANNLHISGDGWGSTILRWGQSDSGLKLSFSDHNKAPSVKDLSLKTTQVNLGTALEIVGYFAPSVQQLGPLISGVLIVSDLANEFNGGWLKGIRLSRVWFPRITATSIRGFYDGSLTFGMARAIELDRVQAPSIDNFTILHVITGIEQIGNETYPNAFGEGVKISDFQIAGVRTGIVLNHNAGIAGTSISEGHINASYRCITAKNHIQMLYHNLQFYKTNPSTENWVGLVLDTADGSIVDSVSIGGDPGVSGALDVGIQVGNSGAVKVDKIFVDHFGGDVYGLLQGTGCVGLEGTRITMAEHNVGAVDAVKIVDGTGGIFRDNYPLPQQILAANSTTPSVDNSLRPEWRSANTSSTSITNLTGGIEGQVVKLLINDNFTTVTSGVNINLQGGASLTGNGAILSLCMREGIWREEARRTA